MVRSHPLFPSRLLTSSSWVSAVLPGFSCASGEVCGGGSNCVSGLCRCPGGQIAQGSVCVARPSVPPGSRCSGGEDCGGGSFCNGAYCICPNGMSGDSGVCTSTTSGTSSFCKHNEQGSK